MLKMAHELGKISLRRLYDHMKVVAHKHVSVHPNLVDPDRNLELIEKDRAIPVVSKDILPLVAAAGNVIKSSRIVYP
jgi:hypothetical protein